MDIRSKVIEIIADQAIIETSDVSDERLGDQSIYFEGDRPPDGEGFVTLLDVNNDGHIDIFDRRSALPPQDDFPLQASSSIWLNDGTGYFSDVPPTVFPTVEPKYLAPRYGDHWQVQGMPWAAPMHLNDDGYIDIVTCGAPPQGVSDRSGGAGGHRGVMRGGRGDRRGEG